MEGPNPIPRLEFSNIRGSLSGKKNLIAAKGAIFP